MRFPKDTGRQEENTENNGLLVIPLSNKKDNGGGNSEGATITIGGHQEMKTKERKIFKEERFIDHFRCYSEVKIKTEIFPLNLATESSLITFFRVLGTETEES